MAEMSTNDSASLWTIEGQMQAIEQGPGGGFVRGISVQFVTRSGLRGAVFVTDAVYNAPGGAEAVRSAVAGRAAQMEKIQGLSG